VVGKNASITATPPGILPPGGGIELVSCPGWSRHSLGNQTKALPATAEVHLQAFGRRSRGDSQKQRIGRGKQVLPHAASYLSIGAIGAFAPISVAVRTGAAGEIWPPFREAARNRRSMGATIEIGLRSHGTI